MKSFSFGDFNVTFTDKRTAIITYQVTIDAKTDGKDASGTFNTASVWRSKKGQWQAVFHSQTKAEPAPPSDELTLSSIRQNSADLAESIPVAVVGDHGAAQNRTAVSDRGYSLRLDDL